MKVIGYVRVSTSGQAKDGYSLAYQQDEIRSYCQEQGWHLQDIFTDEGISGAKVDDDTLEVDRIGFQSMLSALATRTYDAVIVLNTSRLWRSDIVKVLVHREFKRYGVDVKSIEQPTYSIHKKDPSDFLINGLMELLDAYQRLEISMKLSRGRNKKAQQGGYAGGRAAFGYKANKGQKAIEVNLDKALAVQRMFELKELFPNWSLSQFAFQMNEDGFTTQQGKRFTKVQVKRILDRKAFYEGLYLYGGIQADGLHQAII
jgi:DNA invertase Pin-like site-specific DNA recombinase